MTYVKVKDRTVEKYPYSFRDLRADYPNTSFPATLTDNRLGKYGMFPVTRDPKPTAPPGQIAMPNEVPDMRELTWHLGWTVRSMTNDELLRWRGGLVCSRMQGVLALGEANWQAVLDYRDTTASWAERMVIDGASEWRRTSEDIAFFGFLLNFTDTEMDDLFTTAMQIKA